MIKLSEEGRVLERQESLQEGIQKSLLVVVKNLLNKNYDIQSIQEISEITEEELEKVLKQL